MLKTNPITGRKYRVGDFTIDRIVDLLLLVSVNVDHGTVNSWNPIQRLEASDWAIRVYLRASDNFNRVPPRPEHVPHQI